MILAALRRRCRETWSEVSQCRVAHANVRSWRNHWKSFIKRLVMYPWYQKQCLWCLTSVLSEYIGGKPLPWPDSCFCQKYQWNPKNRVREIPWPRARQREIISKILILRIQFWELRKLFSPRWEQQSIWILFCCHSDVCVYRLKWLPPLLTQNKRFEKIDFWKL